MADARKTGGLITFIESSVCQALCWLLTMDDLVQSSQHPRRWVLLKRPFYRWENRVTEKGKNGNFLKSLQLLHLAPLATINQVLPSGSLVRWGYIEMSIIRGSMKQVLNWDRKTSAGGRAIFGMMAWTQDTSHLFAKQLEEREIPQQILEWSRKESARVHPPAGTGSAEFVLKRPVVKMWR